MSDLLTRMDWDDLRFFLAVARSGSLRGAADLLGSNHTTVSRRLTNLEKGLEARLFDRTRSGLVPTTVGELLFAHAERVDDEIATATRLVAGQDKKPEGNITISLAPAISLTSIAADFAAFMKRHREIELRILTTNALSDLDKREADVSLRYTDEVKDNVVGRRLLHCAKAVYCSPDYATRVHDDGGQGLDWIGWGEAFDDLTPPWIKESPFPKARLRHRVNEAVAQTMMASHGLGLTYLPCFLADPQVGLVRAPFQEPVPDRSLWLLLHPDLRETARIRLLVDFLVARIRSRSQEFLAGITPPV